MVTDQISSFIDSGVKLKKHNKHQHNHNIRNNPIHPNMPNNSNSTKKKPGKTIELVGIALESGKILSADVVVVATCLNVRSWTHIICLE